MSKKKRSEQTNKDDTANHSTIEAGDYQFLLSLEENRKATTIITCASLLWAMAIIIPEVFADNAISADKSNFQLVIILYSLLFFFCLCCSVTAIAENKVKKVDKADNSEEMDLQILYQKICVENNSRKILANLAWFCLLFLLIFFVLIVLFALKII